MILQKLIEHSQKLDMPPAGYESVPIKYIFDLDENGKFIETAILDGGAGARDTGILLNTPTQANQKAAKLLVGNGEFVFGVRKPPKEEETKEKRTLEEKKVAKRHQEFKALLEKCDRETSSKLIAAVLSFYKTADYKEIFRNANFDSNNRISFRINRKYPFNGEEIKKFWASRNKSSATKSEDIICHLCEKNPAVDRLPTKIKGIPNSKATALISANTNAFESYGLHNSKVGPVCTDCAEKFTFTINHLLSDEDSHLTVGKQVYVFWSKGGEFSPVKALQKPDEFFGEMDFGKSDDPEEVKLMFKSAFSGKKVAIDNHDDKFYAAALSATEARATLRDWLETTIPKAKGNLVQYFTNCYIKYQDHPHGIFSLASSTVFDARKDLPPNTYTKLLNTALKGARLPEDLLYRAINRAKAEKKPITHPRASLIKLYFLTNSKHKEINMVQLDTKSQKPAYLCGRLMAVLEEIQAGALGSTNATIVDRYYGTASTAPATVFSTLLSGSRHHLAKLRKGKPGYYTNLEKKLQEVVSDLHEFPKVLSLEEQGLFALGYYHQKQERFQKTEKEEK